ncbi:TonB-dependent receptor [Ferruginibacter paludis]|uniref:TonB-dependent receptor n=1 Tax=Ferruginibacter paludis TaxID=1310417 RepID=UPI0025B45009|nr:TonB-dependent receptor [Ferruginibacter paludis]MDN3656114.1 TonB-dependent receptor [Ferruginibacter paludis]
MKKSIFLINALFISYFLPAQHNKLSGVIIDSTTKQPVFGATILLNPGGKSVSADEMGKFILNNISATIIHLTISAIGYEQRYFTIVANSPEQIIKMKRQQTKLSDVLVTSYSGNPYKVLAETDIGMRGVANSQEVLRMVPGLFIGQHQGGGKAEQIFLRGFDADHGSDISIHMDGIPVNLVSHAHSKGYADSHFIIPETIERATFNKGPYDVEKGDQATAGWLDFNTVNKLSNNTIKLEAGQFSTFRALAMIDLLNSGIRPCKASWYAATEYSYSNSYFENHQHFKRFNFFTKFNYKISERQLISISASSFWSGWFASGQIPERAIDSGLVNYYGALDPNEGGVTSRTNFNIQLKSSLKNGGLVKNQLYYSFYKFDLHSNFTFYLDDPVNGDEIRQREKRNLVGYNGSYLHDGRIGNLKSTILYGVNIRLDITNNTELSHTHDRYVFLNLQKLGAITELGSSMYMNETIKLSGRWTIKGGMRFDHFHYRYNNKFNNDPTLKGSGIYRASNYIISPKININYQASTNTQLYLSFGKGFHTNDARVVVSGNGKQTLPAAYGSDVGVLYKPLKNLLIQTAVWYSYLQKEYVYAGDGGTVDFSGSTRRLGADLSIRFQPVKSMFFDLDLNYANGRSLNEVKGNNYIPLAPVWSSTAGISYINKTGWNASLRYRYLSNRPANEYYSFTCEGYFVNDLVIKYKAQRYEYGMVIDNLFNIKWKETQFATVTRLKNEQAAVDGISFTPGTKFAAKFSFSYYFGFKNLMKADK